jgi:osmotically-inducible protein OsmY
MKGRYTVRYEDVGLRNDVLRALEWEPAIDPAGIGVAVEDRVVTLFGHVDSLARMRAVERAVHRVRGVAAVVDEIEIRLPIESQRSDAEIARAAAMALEWNVWVPHGRVTPMVHDGVVVLSGDVDRQYQREAAVEAVRTLLGVRRVIDEIALVPGEPHVDAKAAVEQALARSSEIDASGITVELAGARIVLRGAVRTWAEREEAERIAWAAPGTAAVENELAIRLTAAVGG